MEESGGPSHMVVVRWVVWKLETGKLVGLLCG